MTSHKNYFDTQKCSKTSNNCSEYKIILQSIKDTVDDEHFNHINEVEATLNNVTLKTIKTMQQIYSDNNLIIQTNNGIEATIQFNLQICIDLMEISNNILRGIMKHNSVPCCQIPSLPVNMAYIIFYTFDHCKSCQRIYNCFYKSVPEILVLFRKTQEAHAIFLNLLDNYLIFDFSNEKDLAINRDVLNVILKISKTLSGINMKSMTENWKFFITSVQKLLAQDSRAINLSPAILLLTEEIDEYLSAVTGLEPGDLKKLNYIKIAGFLLKVLLKLFEIGFGTSENDYDIVLKFWIMMYNYGSHFQSNKCLDESMNSGYVLFQLCRDSLPPLVSRDDTLLKRAFSLNENSLKPTLGLLMFINDLMKELPVLSRHDKKIFNDGQLTSLLQLLIYCIKNCCSDYLCETASSNIYEELIINFCGAALLSTSSFSEVEHTLLKCIIEENTLLFLVAMDIWCLILRHSTENVCRLTFSTLVQKMENLRLGIFKEAAVIIRLKIFTQRVFKILSDNTKNEELSRRNPSSNASTWKIVCLKNIPLSHRYYVEFIISDTLERLDIIEKDTSLYEFTLLVETLEVLSYTNFSALEINISRLASAMDKLWLFDIEALSNNTFFKYFILKLMKFTVAVIHELSGQNLLQILSQVKLLICDDSTKLLSCALMHALWRKNVDEFEEKQTLFALMSDLFKILMSDRKSVVVEQALESFKKISSTCKYDSVVLQLTNSSLDIKKLITDFAQKTAGEADYNTKHLKKFANDDTIYHQCLDWNNYQPWPKKVKIEDDSNEIDAIVRTLKKDSDNLLNIAKTKNLNTTQVADIKGILDQLETLIN